MFLLRHGIKIFIFKTFQFISRYLVMPDLVKFFGVGQVHWSYALPASILLFC